MAAKVVTVTSVNGFLGSGTGPLLVVHDAPGAIPDPMVVSLKPPLLEKYSLTSLWSFLPFAEVV